MKRLSLTKMFVKSILITALMAAGAAAERQIVTAPIVVKAGYTLAIQPGDELLFANFTGIRVESGGRLTARGTEEQPITFASVNDTAGAATAFDWDGIEVKSGGAAELSHCRITNATFGVTAADSVGVTLKQCIFSDNGQWSLSIGGVVLVIPDGAEAYDYAAQPPQLVIPPLAATQDDGVGEDQLVTTNKTPTKPAKVKGSRRTAKWLLGSAGVAAAAAGAAYLYKANGYAEEYNVYLPGKAGFELPETRQGRFDKLRGQHNTAANVGWSLLGLAVIDGICLTFVF